MQYFTRKVRPAGLVCMLFALWASPVGAQFLFSTTPHQSDLASEVNEAQIDWGRDRYLATGEGTVPSSDEEPNRSKAYLKAKGYAKMKAVANLLRAVEGTAVSYKAVGKDYIGKDAKLRQLIEDCVSTVQITSERQEINGDGTVVIVTVSSPMYGQAGPGTAILQSKVRKEEPVEGGPNDLNVDKSKRVRSGEARSRPAGPYGSLIVDCRGLGIERAINPKIRRADGSEIWGTVKTAVDLPKERGLVTYVVGLDDARLRTRTGGNPLIVRAIARAGKRFMCDPVVSDSDAELLLEENARSGFLDRFEVVLAADKE